MAPSYPRLNSHTQYTMYMVTARFYQFPPETPWDAVDAFTGEQPRPMMPCSWCPAMPLQRRAPNNLDPLSINKTPPPFFTTTRKWNDSPVSSSAADLESSAGRQWLVPTSSDDYRLSIGPAHLLFCVLFFSPHPHPRATTTYIFVLSLQHFDLSPLTCLVCIPLTRPTTAHSP